MQQESNECKRRVTSSKLEQINPEIYEWWLHVFDILEKDIRMPPELSRTFLQKHLPEYLIEQLQQEYELHNQMFSDIPQEKPVVYLGKRIVLPETEESNIDSEEVVAKKLTSFEKEFNLAPTAKFNQYLNFFKRRPDRAAIWRDLSPLSISRMNLSQLAELLSKNIATEFVKWFSSLGGSESNTVTVSNIIEMFEIGSQVSCATSLRVELREIPCIPDEVAKATVMPQKSKRNMLFREIMKDQLASRQKPRLIAFGKSLPKEMKRKPPPPNIYRKWLTCAGIPEKLESMAAVWQGITNLKSTRRYCEYICVNHPNMKPPKYLVDSGMMSAKVIGSVQSLDNTSFGNVSRYSFELK